MCCAKTVGISHGLSNRGQNVNQAVKGDSSSNLKKVKIFDFFEHYGIALK